MIGKPPAGEERVLPPGPQVRAGPRGSALNRARRERSYQVIERLYLESGRVTHRQFAEAWFVGSPPTEGLSDSPCRATFYRHWKGFRERKDLHALHGPPLVTWIFNQFARGRLDPDLSSDTLQFSTVRLLVKEGRIAPAPNPLRRGIASAKRTLRKQSIRMRLQRLQHALGVVLDDLPLAQRWRSAQEFLRYPVAGVGKPNLLKMEAEHHILQEISSTLAANHLDPQILLRLPDCEERFVFVERHRPSDLARWEMDTVLGALIFYLARRYQECIDTILACFLRMAGVVRKRTRTKLDEDRRNESFVLLEKTGPRFRALKEAFALALSRGNAASLRPFERFLARLTNETAAIVDKWRLQRIIASRGFYTRKLAYRLVGLTFDGHDTPSKDLLKALPEVFRFAPFKERVPFPLTKNLSALEIPRHLLVNRRVFEPVVLLTLAEYLAAGRVTVSLSRRFGNLTDGLQSPMSMEEARRWARDRRQTLEKAWTNFEREAKAKSLVHNERIRLHRPPKMLLSWEEKGHQEMHQEVVQKFERRTVLEVVLRVHRETGMLDEFRLQKIAPHQLGESERLEITAGVLAGMGMNLSEEEIAMVLGYRHTLGSIRHFVEQYMTKENLERALQHLQKSWQERGLGKFWGPGDKVSVDGKVIAAFANNLLSKYHFRRGRSGLTIYWFRRDDGIATRVRVLENQAWESWFVPEELLFPLVGKLRESCGDTQAQHLALWGLSELIHRRISARFRRASQVLLFTPDERGRAGLKRLQGINWRILEERLPCMTEVAERIQKSEVKASEVLRRTRLIDSHGHDLAEGFRELGKISRTEFLLRYMTNEWLQQRCQKMCNDAENWNAFHQFMFWGNGGRLQTNDPRRQEEIVLALTIVLDSVVYDNVSTYGEELRAAKARTPVIWDHIEKLGRYAVDPRWFRGAHRRKD